VVICEGFVDAAIVRYRAIGLEEQRLARVAQWAVNGLKPDLTLVVDPPSGNGASSVTPVDRPADRVLSAEKPAAAENLAAVASNGAVPAGPDAADLTGVHEAAEVAGEENEEAVSGLALAGEALSELAAPGQEVPEREQAPASTPAGSTPAASTPAASSPAAPDAGAGTAATESVLDERSGQADDDDEQVDPAQAYRDRASYAPERYMTVQPHPGHLLPEVVERLESVLRQRTPALDDPQPAAAPKVSA
jgi:dTMP kinase